MTDLIDAAGRLPIEFWVLVLLAVVTDGRPFPVRGTGRRPSTVFVSATFVYAILLVWGPALAVLVQTIAVVWGAVRQRLSSRRSLRAIAQLAAAIAGAGLVLDWFGPAPGAVGLPASRLEAIAVLLAALAWFVISYAVVCLELRADYGLAWPQALTRSFGHELRATSALLFLAPALIAPPTWWTILFLLVPMLAVAELAAVSTRQEDQLWHDPLTGLLNRRGLLAELDELTRGGSTRAVRRSDDRFALFLLDLDRFKHVNDALGHAVGDTLLVEVAARLAAAVRQDDLSARLGGDEFAIVASGVGAAREARGLADHIATQLAAPVHLDGLALDVSASVGVALYPDHGHDTSTLLRHADVAMYQAKRSGDTIAVYSHRVDHHTSEQLSLIADLRYALERPDRRAEITVHYQPQVAVRTGEVVGVEALLRWQHPTRGLVDAAAAVSAAEDSPVMQLLTRRAFEDVIAQLASWNAEKLTLRASINVSVRDLHSTDLAHHLTDLVSRHAVQPEQVAVEITETALIADPTRVQATVQYLASVGIGVALDDLGTGYSSLQHLHKLPLTEVKIDRQFVRAMATDHEAHAIVRSVIELASALGLRAVAQGVENAPTHRMLAAEGCEIAQGWYYAPAMAPDELRRWLARRGDVDLRDNAHET